AVYNLGSLYLDAGDLTSAADCFLRVAQLRPWDVDCLNNLAVSFAFMGDTQKARELLEQAVSINQDHEDARVNLDLIRMHSGRDSRDE
ncbi:MAG: tetratricopeptide repeat protein, partial [Abditibacteriota bacterium]|nr:tetratricopeptide repeat protein [Abditibacteriota bacterium]